MTVLDVAYEMHRAATRGWHSVLQPESCSCLAQPFGTPDGMPLHEWRVAPDVLQELYNASPPRHGPNPKASEGAMLLLYGWPVIRDDALRPGTLRLEAVEPVNAASQPPSPGGE